MLYLQQVIETDSIQGQAKMMIGSSLAPHIPLLVPLTGSTGPVVHDRVGRRPSVKVDLATNSHVATLCFCIVHGLCWSVALDFSSCVIWIITLKQALTLG